MTKTDKAIITFYAILGLILLVWAVVYIGGMR
jgi:hypothetical protein